MKIISYPLSALHYLIFGSLLLIFHPIQWIAIHAFGRKTHKAVVDFLNFLLVHVMWMTGNRSYLTFESPLPENTPLIFVANHQSVYDIPPLIWFLRKYAIRFVGKKELGNGTPSITINLRHNGSVLIDRSKPQNAIPQLIEFGKSLQANNDAGFIFPEGTRRRDGKPKPFKTKGLEAIISQMPDGYVVPLTINNSWKVLKYGAFPMGLGNKITFYVHTPIKIDLNNINQQIVEVEKLVVSKII
ncbi:lysophospholipid acyltransferase family protein [Capnocytophaga canis]|uniref:1-acyl-sn-glycerol-3-phosphate acyltransferase 1 n=1 Tax=Capnocytophaga canis TaxID=1848903 RepID=A0A0B7IQJ1_9FLAO|nr:lysophospholipid acyltransferase family protein [Capnocytophaga canis]CEN52864.1 1-acyl-sn-glycerol-3-phosphate acyltransferase 1 [Capnocytophaga canis]